MVQPDSSNNCSPSLARRFAAIFYDAIALLAVWFFAALVIVLIRRGEAVKPGEILFSAYLLLTAFAYFGFCWTRSGQTLGMKSWKIVVVDADSGKTISWRNAAIRFAVSLASWAACGLGFWWALFDRSGRTWHDRLSRSSLRAL